MKKIEFERELENKKQEFGIRFILSFSVISIINIILLYFSEYYNISIFVINKSFLFAMLIISLYTAYILSKSKYNFFAIFSIFFVMCFSIVTYLCLLLCKITETVFVYYIPIIALSLLLTSLKRAIYFTLFIVILCYFLPDLSSVLQLGNFEKQFVNNPKGLKFQQYMSILFSTYFTFLIIYYYLKIDEIKKRYTYSLILDKKKKYTTNITEEPLLSNNSETVYQENNTENEKDKALYDKIITFFENQKPYQDSEFNIKKLAEFVDSNSTYVSKALNKIGNKKFNQLVNEYRINQVLDELENQMHHRFTLEHIYKEAGFSQQSTFNRIFKEKTGVTPSEYIESLH